MEEAESRVMLPYELPDNYVGFAIVRINCPVCGKRFKTTVHLSNFLGEPGGSFHHYPEDGGCGSDFRIIDMQHTSLRVEVVPRGEHAFEAEVKLFA